MPIDPLMNRFRHIHVMGIGGSGMSALAHLLLGLGYDVSGSDIGENAAVRELQSKGAKIYRGHHPQWVQGADLVVISSAIGRDNVELLSARESNIPVIGRAELLAELLRYHRTLAVSGTHGKTTTTATLANILTHAGLDPVFAVGGVMCSTGSSAQWGSGQWAVIEADESDASLLHFYPTLAIITNIDQDHMATYNHSVAQLHHTFLNFIHRVPFYGRVILCIDDPGVRAILPSIQRPVTTYGFSEDADVRLLEGTSLGRSHHWLIRYKDGRELKMTLEMMGQHNAQNALATLLAAQWIGVEDAIALEALSSFRGVERRLQSLGELPWGQSSVWVIDDYGHHPAEVRATLEALKHAFPTRRLVVMFQPHRYSRLRDLMSEFSTAFDAADRVLLLPVYAAGEEPLEGVSHERLAAMLSGNVSCVREEVWWISLRQTLQPGDILLFQGAGHVTQMAKRLVSEPELLDMDNG